MTVPMSETMPVNMICPLSVQAEPVEALPFFLPRTEKAALRQAQGERIGSVPHPLVDFEPVDPEPLLVARRPAAVGVGDGVEAHIAERGLAFADDDRRAVD